MRSFQIVLAAVATIALGASCAFAADTAAVATPPQAQQSAPAQPANPAVQPPAAPAATDSKAVAATDPNAIVCKRLAPETGTRLGSRTQCMTNAKWDEITRQSQASMRDISKAGATMPDKD